MLHAGPRKKFGNLRVVDTNKNIIELKVSERLTRPLSLKNEKRYSMICQPSCTIEASISKKNSWPINDSNIYTYN